MKDKEKELEFFFNRYAERFNQALQGVTVDAKEVAASFATCFVEASPLGVICGKNDDEFLKVIPQGHAFYKAIGVISMTILSNAITFLDTLHAMAKVRWRCDCKRTDNVFIALEFDVIYFVQINEGVKILAYITGDEQAALKEHGLI